MTPVLLLAAALLAPGDPAAKSPAAPPRVALDTSLGRIVLELDPVKAPKSVENFLDYVKSGQYDGTIFHRVIQTFMIQGGGFTADLQQKPTKPPVKNESSNGLSNVRGTIAMARTAAPDSATCQFFINTVDNARGLDNPHAQGSGYAVFGKVVEGMDVVDKIAAVPTGNRGPYQNVPNTPVVIKKASVVK